MWVQAQVAAGMLPFPCEDKGVFPKCWDVNIKGPVEDGWAKDKWGFLVQAQMHPAFSPKVKPWLQTQVSVWSSASRFKSWLRTKRCVVFGSEPGLETRIQHVEAPWLCSGCGQTLFVHVCLYTLLVFCHNFFFKPFFDTLTHSTLADFNFENHPKSGGTSKWPAQCSTPGRCSCSLSLDFLTHVIGLD